MICSKCERPVGMLSENAARPYRTYKDHEITEEGVTEIEVVVCAHAAEKACKRICTNHKKNGGTK